MNILSIEKTQKKLYVTPKPWILKNQYHYE